VQDARVRQPSFEEAIQVLPVHRALLTAARKSVAKWVNRALAVGPEAALKDTYHRPKEPVITEEARLGGVSGMQQAQRSRLSRRTLVTKRLSCHVWTPAIEAGHPSWPQRSKPPCTAFWRSNPCTRNGSGITWRRDPQFEQKWRISCWYISSRPDDGPLPVVTIAVDEKPGLQCPQR
jgi:hypothetical protein